MKIHFSGIGGIGISGLAQFCAHRGDTVQGSDLGKTAITDVLQAKKIRVFFAQTADNITSDIDLLVYTEAVAPDNPERQQAQKLGIKAKSYFEYLGEISTKFKTVAVAGTHGKTTTTALFAAGVKNANFSPNIFVGSTLTEFDGSNFQAGNENWIVCEACEYRDNFQFLDPEIVVLTSLEWDHVDSFPTEDSYFTAFANLINKAKTVIYHTDEPSVEKILANFSGEKIAVQSGKKLDLSLLGEFNQRNARLAEALSQKLNLDQEEFVVGMENFTGAGRRQELLGEKNGVKIYDDYAHHPTEITALLTSFREHFPDKKIGIIFEPHQFSRTKQFFPEFLESLRLADKRAFYPIYAARDTAEDKKFNLKEELKIHPDFGFVENATDTDNFLADFSAGDILIFCGAGVISDFARDWLKKS